jgi:hypothetical protein
VDEITGILILLVYLLTFLIPVNMYAFMRAREERVKTRKVLMTYWKIYGGNNRRK